MTELTSEAADGPGIDLARVFTFFFEDPKWVQKLLLGSLFALLTPLFVGTVFIAGYGLLLAKNRRHRVEPVLPEWDDLGTIFIEGLKGVAISLAHKIPIFLLGLLLALGVVGGAFLSGESGELSGPALYLAIPMLVLGWLLVILLSLALFAYVPSALASFVRTGELGAAFDVGGNVRFIQTNGSTYLTALLALFLAAVVGQLGFAAFCIGVFPTTFWSACAFGYVVGELARMELPS